MKFFKVISIIIFSLLAVNSYSEKVTPIAVGCDTVSGTCFVILKDLFVDTECPSKSQVRMDPDQKGTKGQYSAALAAYMAGKKIEVGSVACHETAPTPAWLYVTD